MSAQHVLGSVVLGTALGWMLSALGSIADAPTGAPRAPDPAASTGPASPAPCPSPPPTPSADELAEARAVHDERQAWFLRRWGEPIDPPPVVPEEYTEEALRRRLEAYPGRVWSTVDCTVWPCTGVLLSEGDPMPEEVRAALAAPHAEVMIGTMNRDGRSLWMIELTFPTEPVTDREQGIWMRSLARNMSQQHGADIRAVLEGAVLADPEAPEAP